MHLEGQVTLITGVSHAGQVGYALAAAFAREGALLSISARTASRVHARAGELRAAGAQVIAIPADLTTEEGAHTRIQETLGASGQITVLVNLAGGLTTSKPPDEFSLAEWEAELNNTLVSNAQGAICFCAMPSRRKKMYSAFYSSMEAVEERCGVGTLAVPV